MKGWIVVANSSYAEIYAIKDLEVSKVDLIDFPNGRLKGINILTDRPGRAFESTGTGRRSALGSEVDVHEHEQETFAHQLVSTLKKAQNEKSFDYLIFVAPPEFLGTLRSFLPEGLKKLVKQEIKKDIPEGLTENERLEKLYKLLDMKKKTSASPWG